MLFLEINLWFSKIDEITSPDVKYFFHSNFEPWQNYVSGFLFFFLIFEVTRDSDSTHMTRTRHWGLGLEVWGLQYKSGICLLLLLLEYVFIFYSCSFVRFKQN